MKKNNLKYLIKNIIEEMDTGNIATSEVGKIEDPEKDEDDLEDEINEEHDYATDEEIEMISKETEEYYNQSESMLKELMKQEYKETGWMSSFDKYIEIIREMFEEAGEPLTEEEEIALAGLYETISAEPENFLGVVEGSIVDNTYSILLDEEWVKDSFEYLLNEDINEIKEFDSYLNEIKSIYKKFTNDEFDEDLIGPLKKRYDIFVGGF